MWCSVPFHAWFETQDLKGLLLNFSHSTICDSRGKEQQGYSSGEYFTIPNTEGCFSELRKLLCNFAGVIETRLEPINLRTIADGDKATFVFDPWGEMLLPLPVAYARKSNGNLHTFKLLEGQFSEEPPFLQLLNTTDADIEANTKLMLADV